nr:ribonuclease H-like domain-containing protein [Tanacetum cinerariifolium]GEX39637.1 ribonuclease H-like domain-containing protein [Tanacetum cinerariifolium]
MQSPFLSNPPEFSSQPEGEQTKIYKGKKAMSLKDAEESTESDPDDNETGHVPGFMIESSRIKKAKKFDFVTKDGKHIYLTEEQINQQNKIEEEAKTKASRREGEIRKEELIDLLGPEVACLYMHDHREPHLAALKRILRYVRSTFDYGLQLYLSSTSSLVTYSDADWA